MPSPHIDITWEAAAALAAILTLIGIFMTRYINSALNAFELRLFSRLDATYVRTEVCRAQHDICAADKERRLEVLEKASRVNERFSDDRIRAQASRLLDERDRDADVRHRLDSLEESASEG